MEPGPDLSPRLPVHSPTCTASTLRLTAGLPPPACLPQQQESSQGNERKMVWGRSGETRVIVECSMDCILVLRNLHCFFKLTLPQPAYGLIHKLWNLIKT